jgi:hypothetical protein
MSVSQGKTLASQAVLIAKSLFEKGVRKAALKPSRTLGDEVVGEFRVCSPSSSTTPGCVPLSQPALRGEWAFCF